MSFIVTPEPAAVDIAASLTEWPTKIDTSIPANLRVSSYSQWAIVIGRRGCSLQEPISL